MTLLRYSAGFLELSHLFSCSSRAGGLRHSSLTPHKARFTFLKPLFFLLFGRGRVFRSPTYKRLTGCLYVFEMRTVCICLNKVIRRSQHGRLRKTLFGFQRSKLPSYDLCLQSLKNFLCRYVNLVSIPVKLIILCCALTFGCICVKVSRFKNLLYYNYCV